MDINKVLIATDFSECGNFSIVRGLQLAETFKASATILHVVTENLQEMPLFFLTDEKMEELEQHLLSKASNTLNQAVESVDSPEGVSVDVKIRQGVPYREIVQEAEDGEYDLIVLGARGKSRLKEFLYGSNAEKVVRRAHCSVYLVKTPCELS